MHRTAVINVVGLTESLIGPHTPRIRSFRDRGALAKIVPAFPAVTCSAQSTYLTGATPAQHGIVGNGWYDRELAEVQFWKQSNRLVRGRKIWEELRELEPGFTCAKLFWWYNMYSTADFLTFIRGRIRSESRLKKTWASFRLRRSGGRPRACRHRRVRRTRHRAGLRSPQNGLKRNTRRR